MSVAVSNAVPASTTSAVVATAFGGPEVLSLVEVPLAEPGPGEVRVAVHAVGVNPFDFKSYSGDYGNDPTALPKRIGSEAAGVVTAVGPEAIGPAGAVNVGDEVIAYPISGAYATDLLLPATAVVPKPVGMTWEEAAGLLLTGVTAWHALAAASVEAGDTVLIHGAAGGVGLMAVQLAVARGASVIGTASLPQHTVLGSFGATPVTYGDGLAERVRTLAGNGIDAALDLVGTDEALDVSLEFVDDRKRIVSTVNFSAGGPAGIKLIGAGPGADSGTQIRREARMKLIELVEAGQLKVQVNRMYPLADAAAAHRAVMSGHGTGKTILIV